MKETAETPTAGNQASGPARAAELRQQILALAEEYFAEQFKTQPFVAGESAVPVSGKVLDAADLRNLVDASLDFWLTTGRFANEFERQFARFFGVRGALAGQLRLVGQPGGLFLLDLAQAWATGACSPGDEVITVAAGFPTTVNPIIQNRWSRSLST